MNAAAKAYADLVVEEAFQFMGRKYKVGAARIKDAMLGKFGEEAQRKVAKEFGEYMKVAQDALPAIHEMVAA